MTLRAPKIVPRDVPLEAAVRRLGLTLEQFTPIRDRLHARGFPRPDADTGMVDLKAVEDWMDRRSGLTGVGPAKDASGVVRDRLEALRGGKR